MRDGIRSAGIDQVSNWTHSGCPKGFASFPRFGDLLAHALDGVPQAPAEAGAAWVERFDRRGIEPFELFTSEFGQNSFKIQEFSLENSKISEKIFNFNIFLKYRRDSDKI